ncbi:pyruvate dehydrogenase (acetyl-transferring) E1 component subunit alpha [Psychromicrobium sp. YIM B11713]|uniref:pyruvate dehydrogenase (acetyl-transferring) E1 component subunit alpha n=1 Tax=Psychromicrobium sp. YIM B11713 TaxID=3145233 RepID=UPI00374EB248
MPAENTGVEGDSSLPGLSGRNVPVDNNFIQLLSPSGERLANPEYDQWIADVTAEQLVSFYEDMVVVRRIDTEATALQRQGQLALWAPLLGQEAAQIGSARALREDDFVFPSYRENGVAYVRGINLVNSLKIWRGNTHGGWDPFEFNMATPQIIIGAQALHATGYAMGVLNDGADSAVVTYFGDGATSQGDVNEAMVFAASFQAPVVFFCQNNHWAISEPVGLQAHQVIADRAPGFGIPAYRVDGNDILAVLAASRAALARARSGGGPSFIEAVTYRMGPHTTADDPTRYRDANELEDWAAKDPIARLAAYLEAQGVLTEEVQAAVQAKSDAVAKDLRANTIALPEPTALQVFDNVYSEPHSALQRQREQYEHYLAGFGPVELSTAESGVADTISAEGANR